MRIALWWDLASGTARLRGCVLESSAARGRRPEHQRYGKRRSAIAPSHRLLSGVVGGPSRGGVGGPGVEGRLAAGI